MYTRMDGLGNVAEMKAGNELSGPGLRSSNDSASWMDYHRIGLYGYEA